MPELPEVETVRRGLAHAIVGRRVLAVDVGRERSVRRMGRQATIAPLMDKTFTGAQRRGKYLILTTDDNCEVMIHLRMSGRVLIQSPQEPRPAHSHVNVLLSPRGNEAGDNPEMSRCVEMRFVDPRTFGEFVVYPADLRDEVVPEWKRLGVDPVVDRFDGRILRDALATTRRPIKAALLDQSLIAGIGNIYADEALHRAGLRWNRPANSLSAQACGRLADAISSVLATAIEAGGSTLEDTQYVGVDGESGWFQTEHRVYGRTGERCITCGKSWVSREVVAGRSTHYCKRCQR